MEEPMAGWPQTRTSQRNQRQFGGHSKPVQWQRTTSYMIWANNSGGSTSAITITINDEPPGPFEYIPENNTWTNNSYVNIGPSFINETSGNGSTWTLTNFRSLPRLDGE